MNLNTSNLSHPRIQWAIEAAMWRAIENSRERGVGVASVQSATDKHLVGVMHDRQAIPAFSFWRRGQDITDQIIPVLRTFACAQKTSCGPGTPGAC